MSVNDKTENRGTHGVSSSMLDTLVSSSENPLTLDMGSVNDLKRPICPCVKNCPNRSAQCAKTCSAWKKYEADRADFYEKRTKYIDSCTFNHGMSRVVRKMYRDRQRLAYR